MGSSDEVRRLLDERGVEHEDSDISVGEKAYGATTCWECGDVVARFSEKADVGTLLEAWDASPEQAIAATVGRSCASCPEMDDPDSYISHLQSALKWHDEHVPRPTDPRNTCVVLEGENPPEEVMFVAEGGGVTHYLPEATCKQEDWSTEGDHARVWLTCGHDCMVETVADLPKFCPECGARVKED